MIPIPFALSLSKGTYPPMLRSLGRQCFDKLSTNGNWRAAAKPRRTALERRRPVA